MFSGVAVALPAMGRDLATGATGLGLVETTFLAGSLAFLLPAGGLADAMDKRALYKASLLAFTAISLAISLLPWLAGILCLRFLQGIVSAVFAATGMAILAELVPAERRGKVFGAAMGVLYAGLTLGPIVAGAVVETWDWRAVFWVGAASGLACWAMVNWQLPSKWLRPRNALHGPSVILVMMAVLAVVGGSATLRIGWTGVGLMATGLVLGSAFVVMQLFTDRPLVDLRRLRGNRALRSALWVQMIIYLHAACSIFMLSLFLQVPQGHSAAATGQTIAVGAVVMALCAPLAGILSDRSYPSLVAGLGATGVLGSALLGMTLTADSSITRAGLVVLAQGIGFGLFSSPNMATIMNSMPSTESGMASALAAKARSLGMVIGMIVAASMISLDYGDAAIEQHPARFIDTMTSVYAMLVVTAALAIVSIALGARHTPPTTEFGQRSRTD